MKLPVYSICGSLHEYIHQHINILLLNRFPNIEMAVSEMLCLHTNHAVRQSSTIVYKGLKRLDSMVSTPVLNGSCFIHLRM